MGDFRTRRSDGQVFPLERNGISSDSIHRHESDVIESTIESADVVNSTKVIIEEIKKQPNSIKEEIDEIELLISNNDTLPFAFVDTDKNKLGFRLNEDIHGKEWKPIVEHEIEHLKYQEIKENHPEKLEEFKSEINEIEPFTINLERIHDELEHAKEHGTEQQVKRLKEEYVDEVNSETAEQIAFEKHNLDPYNLTNPEELEKAIEIYDELHEGVHFKNPDWHVHKISKHDIERLKEASEKGEHIGFRNLADIIYTNELENHSPERAKEIALGRASIQAREGVHHRHHMRTV